MTVWVALALMLALALSACGAERYSSEWAQQQRDQPVPAWAQEEAAALGCDELDQHTTTRLADMDPEEAARAYWLNGAISDRAEELDCPEARAIPQLLALSLDLSDTKNGRSEPFTLEGTAARVHWEVAARYDAHCFFSAALVGLNDAGEIHSYDLIAAVTIPSGATNEVMRRGGQNAPDTKSGDVIFEVTPGAFVVIMIAELRRYADGSTEACEGYRVTVDG